MSVIFDTIPTNIRTNTNHFEINSSRAVQGAQIKPKKVLLMGIRLAAGSVAELIPKRITSGDQAAGYWGAGSQIAEEAYAFRAANTSIELWGCAINESAGGTVGTKTITVSGTATETRTLALYVQGIYVPVAVNSGDVATVVATAINTALQAHRMYKRMSVTSGVSGAVVTLTMRWKGVEVIDVRANYQNSDALPAGISVAVATGVSGAGNPALSSIITAIGHVWYDGFVNPFTDATNLTALEGELNFRFGGGFGAQIEGLAFSAVLGNYATASGLGASRNSRDVSIIGANVSPTPSWVWAASYGATVLGDPDPARPKQTLVIPGVLPADPTLQWSDSDRNLLLYSGIATHVVDPGGNVTIENAISTYQVNAQSVPDEAYLEIETWLTLAAIRYDARTSVSLQYPRHKLADDDAKLPSGQPIMTPKLMKGHLIARFDLWTELGWVEGASRAQFIAELVVQRDPANVNRLVAQLGPNLMNQFRGLSAQIAFIL